MYNFRYNLQGPFFCNLITFFEDLKIYKLTTKLIIKEKNLMNCLENITHTLNDLQSTEII